MSHADLYRSLAVELQLSERDVHPDDLSTVRKLGAGLLAIASLIATAESWVGQGRPFVRSVRNIGTRIAAGIEGLRPYLKDNHAALERGRPHERLPRLVLPSVLERFLDGKDVDPDPEAEAS